MMSYEDLERVAEAIVFAHDVDVALPSESAEVAELERAAVMVSVARSVVAPVPEPLRLRLASDGLQFCSLRATELASHRTANHRGMRIVADGELASGRSMAMPFLLGVAAVALVWIATASLAGKASPAPPSAQRVAMLSDQGVRRLEWQPGSSPLTGDVTGDVVWSDAEQRGYLTFRGLPPLDDEHRFQLWIVDGKREGAPIDGGLFDIASAGDQTVVPINAALPIGKAAAFVVTVEERAGVVVSKQEHVVAIAGL